MKYARRADVAQPLSRLLLPAAQRYEGLVDAVIPLPLHPRRYAARGFNQVSLLFAPFARSLGAPLQASWLTRARDTPPQAALSLRDRATNLRGAFRARAGCGRRILLVDDVRTTGATLAAAAHAMREAGAEDIRALTLCRRSLASEAANLAG